MFILAPITHLIINLLQPYNSCVTFTSDKLAIYRCRWLFQMVCIRKNMFLCLNCPHQMYVYFFWKHIAVFLRLRPFYFDSYSRTYVWAIWFMIGHIDCLDGNCQWPTVGLWFSRWLVLVQWKTARLTKQSICTETIYTYLCAKFLQKLNDKCRLLG